MMQAAAPATRRRLAPTASLPSTAEEQAQRHGIPADISNALQGNVGSRIRQAISAGRSGAFGRTQSQPAFNIGPSTFATNDQIMQEAQSVINRDDARRRARELQPYGSNESNGMNALDLASGSGRPASPPERKRRLRFGPDGEVELEDESRDPVSRGGGGMREFWATSHSKKRGADDGDAEDVDDGISDTATEVDEDVNLDDAPHRPGLLPSSSASGSGSTMADDFPAVFTSPAISHPALFTTVTHTYPNGAMLPPQTTRPGGPGAREMRGLPGRALGKTVSAPVRLTGGMEVDQDEMLPDGFDVSEWAGQTDF